MKRSLVVTIVVVALAAIVFSVYDFHTSSNSKNTPYWSNWDSWQKSARPHLLFLNKDLGDFVRDSNDSAGSTSSVAVHKVANDLLAVGVQVLSLQHLTESPDAVLNAKLNTYITAIGQFQANFSAHLANTKVNVLYWIRTQIVDIKNAGLAMQSELNREIALFNAR